MVDVFLIFGLGLTHIFSTCSFFLFLYFFRKSLNRIKTQEILPFVGLSIIFLFISIGFIVLSWTDYFWWVSGEITNPYTGLETLTGLFIIGSFICLTFILEFCLKKTKYIFTIYMVAGFVFLNVIGANALNLLIYLLPFPFFCISLWYFVFIRPTSGFLRRRMILAVFGFLNLLVGFFLRYNFMVQLFGTYIYLVGTIISIFGVILIGYGFIAFSTFSDIKWKEKLREIFVISEGGICIFAYSFEKKTPLDDTDLIAGGFSGIQSMLSEMVKTSENLQLINYQNLKIMLEQGRKVFFILIINEESSFLYFKLKHFSEEFQNFFQDVLAKWTGKIEVFQPTRALIDRIFEVEY